MRNVILLLALFLLLPAFGCGPQNPHPPLSCHDSWNELGAEAFHGC